MTLGNEMQTNTQHTPGPWHYGQDVMGRKRVYAGDYEIVRALSTHGYQRRLSASEREASARLIAAAPDLLEALRKLVSFASFVTEGDYEDEPEEIAAARAAIAKAVQS